MTAELECLRATPDILRRLVQVAACDQLLWNRLTSDGLFVKVLNHLIDVEKLNLGLRVHP